jgi:hypothetical protein
MPDQIKKSLKIRTGQQDPKFNTEMILTPYLADRFKDSFEIEFLQGESVTLKDGRIHLKFNLTEEKMLVLKRAINNAVFGNPDERTS